MLSAIKRTFNFIVKHPLAKRHKYRSFYRFMNWQLSSSMSTGLIAVPFVEHTRFWAKKKLTGVTGNIYTGLHEFEDMAFVIHLLQKDDVFFDVGANVGSYTILASGLKEAKTIAFEPIQNAFEILLANIELNELQQMVKCEQMAVGSKKEVLFFTNDEDTTNHCVENASANTTTVQAIHLDHYYPELCPILLKIDVEGFETEVIKGATHILASASLKAIVIELNGSGDRYGYDDAHIHQQLLSLGFLPYLYDPFQRKLNLKNHFNGFNTIYVRDIDFVSARLSSGKPFVIFNEKI